MIEVDPSSVCLVTGATSGIGRAVMDLLAEQGLSLIGVGRSAERNRTAADELRQVYPQSRVQYLRCDLAQQQEVRELADRVTQILDEWGRGGLDALVNNAAVVPFRRELTDEGVEKQWAVNHLAPFLLTISLMQRLERAPRARVVTVSSGSHRGARIRWHDLEQQRGFYNSLQAYGQSKLANVLFTLELNRRLGPASPVEAYAADPGLVNTDLGSKESPFFVRWLWDLWKRGGISPHQAAEGVVKLVLDPEVSLTKGIYWRRGRPIEPGPRALDPEAARRLWRVSAEMCGLAGEDLDNVARST